MAMCIIVETYKEPIPKRIGYKVLRLTKRGLVGAVSMYPFHLGEADKLSPYTAYRIKTLDYKRTAILIDKVEYKMQHAGKWSLYNNAYNVEWFSEESVIVECECEDITHNTIDGFLAKRITSIKVIQIGSDIKKSKRLSKLLDAALLQLTES